MLRELAIEQGYRHEDLSHRLLKAATLDGAQAMNMSSGANGVGSIEAGKNADFAILAIDALAENAEDRIVTNGAGHCVATVVSGNLRFDEQDPSVRSDTA